MADIIFLPFLVRGILGAHLTAGAVVLGLHGAILHHALLLTLALLMAHLLALGLVLFVGLAHRFNRTIIPYEPSSSRRAFLPRP